jgi:hypothetical protein
MSSSLQRMGMILGLVLVLWGGLSWGQLPATNDTSDAQGNTGGGTGTLGSNTTGIANTAYGADALRSNTMGLANTASGSDALFNNTEGSGNTASGVNALLDNTTGTENTASGFSALLDNTTGNNNIASGAFALARNTTGSGNIALGFQAGVNLEAGSANIYLGHPGMATESNTMRLGEDQTRTFIAGVTDVPVSGRAVFISPTGQLGVKASSARYKHAIEPLGAHRQGLGQLRPVTFRYRQDPQGARQYGLIAEEVATVYSELVIRSATGEIESVQYEVLIPLLLNELQHQQRQVAELQAQNERIQTLAVQLQQRDEVQQAQNAALAARLEQLEAAAARATAWTSR